MLKGKLVLCLKPGQSFFCRAACLALLACIFFSPFLLCFLANLMFLRNLGSTPLRDSYLWDLGFLMPFLCHLRDWLCVVWFLDLAMAAPAGQKTRHSSARLSATLVWLGPASRSAPAVCCAGAQRRERPTERGCSRIARSGTYRTHSRQHHTSLFCCF